MADAFIATPADAVTGFANAASIAAISCGDITTWQGSRISSCAPVACRSHAVTAFFTAVTPSSAVCASLERERSALEIPSNRRWLAVRRALAAFAAWPVESNAVLALLASRDNSRKRFARSRNVRATLSTAPVFHRRSSDHQKSPNGTICALPCNRQPIAPAPGETTVRCLSRRDP